MGQWQGGGLSCSTVGQAKAREERALGLGVLRDLRPHWGLSVSCSHCDDEHLPLGAFGSFLLSVLGEAGCKAGTVRLPGTCHILGAHPH